MNNSKKRPEFDKVLLEQLVKLYSTYVPVKLWHRAFRDLAVLVPGNLLQEYELIIDSIREQLPESSELAVFLIHGIRTDAAWYERFIGEFKDLPDVQVIPVGYHFFNVFLFLIPWLRTSAFNSVANQLRHSFSERSFGKKVVVAHSFGTYLLGEFLIRFPAYRFDRIILAGSVLNHRYDWNVNARTIKRGDVLNEVGVADIFPVLAYAFSSGCGAAGYCGFRHAKVVDKFFNFGHSDALAVAHIKEHWLPFILRGEVVEANVMPRPMWWSYFANVGCGFERQYIVWIFRFCFYCMFLLGLWILFRKFM